MTDSFGGTTSSQFTLTVAQPVPVMPFWGFAALAILLVVIASRFLPKEPGATR